MEDELVKRPIVTKKTVFSVILTLLLGPGIGHLYLRKFRQGAYLIAATLFFAVHQALKVLKNLSKEEIATLTSRDITAIFQQFAANYPSTILFYDIAFAAIWAYALLDVYNKSRE